MAIARDLEVLVEYEWPNCEVVVAVVVGEDVRSEEACCSVKKMRKS